MGIFNNLFDIDSRDSYAVTGLNKELNSLYIYNYGSLSDIDTIVIKIERFFNLDILNKFRMPMFIFISGFLFSFLHYKKHKYPKFIDLFTNKFKRLLIPYWVFFPITGSLFGKINSFIG